MDDIDPALEPATTDLLGVGSISSMLPADSLSDDPVAVLGERILAELGEDRTNNTLTRWLAHHTARLVDAADKAREAGDPKAGDREDAARAAILQLWQARSSWPEGWPPPRAAEMAQMLDSLPGLDAADCHRPFGPVRLHTMHFQILAALVDLATDTGGSDIEQGWLEVVGDRLSPDEAVLLRRAASQSRLLEEKDRLWGFIDHLNDLDADSASHGQPEVGDADPVPLLITLVDAYREAALGLFSRVNRDDRDKP
ncbi:hypothetical protein ACFU8I_01365 [Streptomyces sp. NPDC057540]|uniref:hypothetical protein n=1 Tax=Streptomyces sp. NPDC057540 TaxID=3346160 RepID=UPI0036CFA478